jgi:hypothetical protein
VRKCSSSLTSLGAYALVAKLKRMEVKGNGKIITSLCFLIDQLAHLEALIFFTALYHIYYLAKILYLYTINYAIIFSPKNIGLISINSLLRLNCYLLNEKFEASKNI